MRLAGLALLGGLVGAMTGCGKSEENGPPADTTAMAPPATTTMTAVEVREMTPGLLAEATFRPADAQQVAVEIFPGGMVTEATIDRSNDDLVYTYRIRDNMGETRTVKINARTGTVVDSGKTNPNPPR